MRIILVDNNGLVYAYISRDGITALVRDDHPGINLFEVNLSDIDFRDFLRRFTSGDNNIVIRTWVSSYVNH